MRDTEVSTQQLAAEREERERERWTLLRHARDEAERSLALAAQLTARETQIQQLQDHIMEVSNFFCIIFCTWKLSGIWLNFIDTL
jgi:hypothetical protein